MRNNLSKILQCNSRVLHSDTYVFCVPTNMYIVSQGKLQSGELQSFRVSQNIPEWAQIHANTMSNFCEHVFNEEETVKPRREGKISPCKAV